MFHYSSQESMNFEIETLLHAGHRLENAIQPVILRPDAEFPSKQRSRHSSKQGDTSKGRYYHPSESSESEDEEEKERTVVLCGADIGDLPTEYTVEGLQGNELPVIGTYVDRSILPGFQYRVRKLGTTRYLFKGKALTLQSIGMGYGKRITFEGESLNHNSNYFYSDTHPNGFGFSLVAAQAGNSFIVRDTDCHPVAEAKLQEVISQRELSSDVKEDGTLVKKVSVTFICTIDYFGDHHGLMPLCSRESLHLTGLAIVVRNKRAHKAHTKFIEQIELQHYGLCTFEA